MKVIDEIERQKKKDRKKWWGGTSYYSESVRAKRFCCAFKLGFVQLIYKAFLIFKTLNSTKSLKKL